MTKKDFELIAHAINTLPVKVLETKESREAIKAVIDSFVYQLSRTNPRFDSDRFIAACLKSNK